MARLETENLGNEAAQLRHELERFQGLSEGTIEPAVSDTPILHVVAVDQGPEATVNVTFRGGPSPLEGDGAADRHVSRHH